MRVEAVKLRNFRAYREDTLVALTDLTAFIGRNDVGKSSVLDALAVFFNDPTVKLESGDLCVYAPDGVSEVRVGCVFSDLPAQIVVDSTAETTLRGEHLVNEDGQLEIHRVFDCSGAKPKERIVAMAVHPTRPDGGSLLRRKNADLKRLARELEVSDVDNRSNVSLRQAIWQAQDDLEARLHEVPLDKEGGRSVWEQIRTHFPVFALFRADRASTDEEAEVQDPMKLAVRQAIDQLEPELRVIREKVQERVTEVAQRTLTKLKEFDPRLANELQPHFRAEPKWDAGFKLSLTGDDAIPINKRGSGVRRLILLSFFRAEAERRLEVDEPTEVIYAIEEPETSQHPDNQRLLVEAFSTLAREGGCQVILTTHVPGLARLLPVEGLRYVRRAEDGRKISVEQDDVVQVVADALGVLPHRDDEVSVVVCVEGKHDVTFIKHMADVLRANGIEVPDLRADPRIVVIPLGGSTLEDWVTHHHLKKFGRREVHIYDRDTDAKYTSAITQVNGRGDGSHGVLTVKREMVLPDIRNRSFLARAV